MTADTHTRRLAQHVAWAHSNLLIIARVAAGELDLQGCTALAANLLLLTQQAEDATDALLGQIEAREREMPRGQTNSN